MQTVIKLTKATARDFDNIVDIYNAEVSRGEYEPNLFYVSAKSNGTSRYDALTINGIDGASMVCDSLVGEIEHCLNSMYEDGSDSNGYQVAYRAKKRLQKLMAQVLDLFPALKEEPYSKENYSSYC